MPGISDLIRMANINGCVRMSQQYLQLFGSDATTMTVRDVLTHLEAGLTGGARHDCKTLLQLFAHSAWQVTTGIHSGRRGPKSDSKKIDNTPHFDVNCRKRTYHCRLTSKTNVLFEITCDGHGAISGHQFFRRPADAEGVGPRNTE